ncbi:MAG TPA: TetR/AcrR family transcriptional regulator [Candidatus Limnocylindrales bacterium]
MGRSAGLGQPDSDASARDAAKEPAARQAIARGARARERVLRAALEVLAEQGLPGFTMEAVAHRAKASKATLYRRWASQGSLLIEAMDQGFQPFPVPATGGLRTNLIELLTRFEALVSSQPFPQLLAVFIDAAERNPSLASLQVELTERRREPIRRLLEQAQHGGEIRAAADLDLAVDLLASPAFYRRFIAHRAFPSDYASAVVDHVLAAIGFSGPDQHDVGSSGGKRRSSPRRSTR